MKTIQLGVDDGIATITFDEPDSAVNTLSQQWQQDLTEVVAAIVERKDSLRGVVLASGKSTFFAGANLKGLMRADSADGPAIFASLERMKRDFRTLETLGIPVVACLNGSALGGGWEVALIAHCRIAVDDERIRFGMPEVKFGLIPAATGISKMTRLLGLIAAQPYLIEGRLFNPREAQGLGLVLQLVGDEAELRSAALAWIAANPVARHPFDGGDFRIPGGVPGSSRTIAGMLGVAPAMLRAKTRGLYPAPQYALACMVEGAQVDFDTACRIESRYFAQLIGNPVTKNMISAFFFDMNTVKSGRSRPAAVPRWKPSRVGVIGAGMMGAGIAQAQAMRGILTVLLDITRDQAEAGKAQAGVLVAKQIKRGRAATLHEEDVLSRIHTTDSVGDLAGCELIMEAVFENRELKARVTREAEAQLPADGVFATNTSSLPISSLAQASARPERFVGIHFPGPVDKMKLVEIVRGDATDDVAVARAYDWALALGKLPIVVNDGRGFFTSCVLASFVMEGAAMLDEGIPAPVIEQASLQAGMPAGPLAVLDDSALSHAVHVLDQTRADVRAGGGTYIATRGELLVERMVKEHDRNGRAAGGGFYEYPHHALARKFLWPRLRDLFEKPGIAWDMQELRDRLLYRQAIETARCLAEGVLTSVHDANIGSIFGIGFPGWAGGAMQFIYAAGVEALLDRAETLAASHGTGFEVTPEVREAIRGYQPRW